MVKIYCTSCQSINFVGVLFISSKSSSLILLQVIFIYFLLHGKFSFHFLRILQTLHVCVYCNIHGIYSSGLLLLFCAISRGQLFFIAHTNCKQFCGFSFPDSQSRDPPTKGCFTCGEARLELAFRRDYKELWTANWATQMRWVLCLELEKTSISQCRSIAKFECVTRH